jgi:hypothetical protein
VFEVDLDVFGNRSYHRSADGLDDHT